MKNTTNRSILLTALTALALTLTAPAADRPNIVVVFTDDLGYADVGFNGSTDISTPNLDRLAAAGTVFTSAYVVHPFCGPSRMGLFSGRYPHQFGGPYNLPQRQDNAYLEHGIPESETLISTVLQDTGYRTGLIGKWHMGVRSEFHPNQRGFDDFYGFLGGGKDYFGPYKSQTQGNTVNDYRTHPEHNGVDDTSLTAQDYITDVLSREAIRFVNESANREEPFFLFLSYNAPHTPLQAKDSDMAKFPRLSGDRKTYAGMVYAVDRGVGKLVDALKANGQFQDTLIVFLSDNGGRTDKGGVNTPLRGRKGDVWEGGFRVPMFMHWPRGIEGATRYEHPVTALDFYPTFARLAGAKLPASKQLDGRDIWDAVTEGRNARPGEPIYAVRYNVGAGETGFSNVGIRLDEWKAVKWFGTSWKLFNITDDIGEEMDLSASHPEVLHRLVSQASKWSEGHITPLWYDNFNAEKEWKKRGMPHYSETFSLP
jgi:arylsulfatase A-like enzyme